jgi:hypothetical protein
MNVPLLSTPPLTDADGLQQAYSQDNGIWTESATMYIAGTKSVRDIWDDAKIPLGLTSWSQRYQDAEKTLSAMPQVRRLVGHSLGGAVALELQKNKGTEATTYGAPVFSAAGGDRHRQLGDPVAMFDFGANTTLPRSLNPHSYHPLAARTTESQVPRDGFFGYDRTLNVYR